MQRLSDQSAHAPSPTKLLAEGREGSAVHDYVPPQARRRLSTQLSDYKST